jgi:phage baseplate assembly protein W
MAFNPQQIYPIDLNASKAVGVDIPFNGSAVFKSNYLTKDAIKNNLINFFLTNPGERYLNPSFGGGIRVFIFEQISQNNLEGLKESIQLQTERYFPNILITSLNISQNEISVFIDFSYNIINTNINDNINLEF